MVMGLALASQAKGVDGVVLAWFIVVCLMGDLLFVLEKRVPAERDQRLKDWKMACSFAKIESYLRRKPTNGMDRRHVS